MLPLMTSTHTELELDLQIACDNRGLPSAACFRQWVQLALGDERPCVELSIRLVDEAESAALNQQYRGKTGPTNVLSFPADLPEALQLPLLGDLVICRAVVEREAEEQDKVPQHHWAHMVIHGTLHLLGFDHINDEDAEQMETKEIELLSQLQITNPYLPICEDSTQNHE